MSRVGVIGAGAWGTALGIAARWAENDVIFWDKETTVINQIAQTHTINTPLEGLSLDPAIQATHLLEEVCDTDIILLVTAAQAIRSVAEKLSKLVSPKTYIVLCSKGIEETTGTLLTDILKTSFPNNPIAILSGPAFAGEVAQGLPTAVSLAADTLQVSRLVSSTLSSRTFRLYPSTDPIGVHLGGAFKNVLAIASGIALGMKLGQNAQASLVTRGLSELIIVGTALGAKPETFMGLSGLGDMILTCTSLTSRNMKFGALIGEGMSMTEVQKSHTKLAEGVSTTKALMNLAERLSVELPICQCVYKVLYEGMTPKEALDILLSRPLKDESL